MGARLVFLSTPSCALTPSLHAHCLHKAFLERQVGVGTVRVCVGGRGGCRLMNHLFWERKGVKDRKMNVVLLSPWREQGGPTVTNNFGDRA